MDRLSETYPLPPGEGGPTASGLAGWVRVEAMTNPCRAFPLLMAWRVKRGAAGQFFFLVILVGLWASGPACGAGVNGFWRLNLTSVARRPLRGGNSVPMAG